MDFSVFNELRLQGTFCDVVINVNGINFSAHKIILCNVSPYFRELFSGAWSNAENNLYNIPNVSAAMMQIFLDYAYTGTVSVTSENVLELLVAADQFNIIGIVNTCCQFLEAQLSPENCIGMWKFTGIYYLPELRQRAFTFILHHFADIVKGSAEFLELTVMELSGIIDKDELNSKKEETVFKAILKWIRHDAASRKQYMSYLLPKIRLALMDESYFLDYVINNKYVRKNKECKQIIRSALKAMHVIQKRGLINSDWENPLTRPRLPHSILISVSGCSDVSLSTDIMAYDVRSDRWEHIASDEDSHRQNQGAAYLNGSVYIIGGTEEMDCTNNVKRFNLETKTFHEVAPMHYNRACFSVAVLDNLIYAIGGNDGSLSLNTAERYDPQTNQWTVIAPMHEQRMCPCVATLFGKIYVCGGNSDGEFLRTAEVYSPETNEWTMIAPMLSKRGGHGVIAYGEKIYAVGGHDGEHFLSSVECYSPENNCWTALPDMLRSRSCFGIGVVDNLLFIVGGLNGTDSTLYDEYFDKDSNQWCCGNNGRPSSLGLSCCVVPGIINLREYATRS